MVFRERVARIGVAVGAAIAITSSAAAAAQEAPAPAPSAATAPAPKATTYIGAPAGYRRATTWDLNIDGALGSTLGEGHALTGFGRVRGGILAVRDANVLALGLTYEYSNLQKATFGIQAEYINDNSGAWIQIGALLDTQPRPGAMLAVGYSLFGVEGQVRSYEPAGVTYALYAKLRIPIGFLAFEMGQ